MKTHFEKYRLILILGLFFVVCGCSLIVAFFSPLDTYSFLFFPSAIILVGFAILYRSLLGKRHTYFVFIGLLLVSSWLFFLLFSSGILPYTVVEAWPILIILSALMLIPLGFIRYGFLPISFIVSACVLFVLGALFLLFSLDIIKMSITTFASRWWPMLFVFFGISLIWLFFYTKKHEHEKWIKNSDDYEDLS